MEYHGYTFGKCSITHFHYFFRIICYCPDLVGANAKFGTNDHAIVSENHLPGGMHDFLFGLWIDDHGKVHVGNDDHVIETGRLDFTWNHDIWMECWLDHDEIGKRDFASLVVREANLLFFCQKRNGLGTRKVKDKGCKESPTLFAKTHKRKDPWGTKLGRHKDIFFPIRFNVQR